MNSLFWSWLDELIETSEMIIDRPKGTRHPKYPDLVFPLDYGYLKGTVGGDGDGIDVWTGTSGRRLSAVVATVDMKKRDAEIKLIIGCTEKEIGIIEEFYNGKYMSGVTIRRE